MASESVTALLEVTNNGSVIGGEELHFYVGGEAVETKFARIPAQTEQQIEFSAQFQEPGTYDVAVGRSSDDLIASRNIKVMPKSEEFEWLAFDGFNVPDTVERSEPFEVTGTITNSGSDETIQVLKMTVDANVVRATRIDLEPGKSMELTFQYTLDAAGEYSIAVEDLSPWTVTVPQPEE